MSPCDLFILSKGEINDARERPIDGFTGAAIILREIMITKLAFRQIAELICLKPETREVFPEEPRALAVYEGYVGEACRYVHQIAGCGIYGLELVPQRAVGGQGEDGWICARSGKGRGESHATHNSDPDASMGIPIGREKWDACAWFQQQVFKSPGHINPLDEISGFAGEKVGKS